MRLGAQQIITREVEASERNARLRTCFDVAMQGPTLHFGGRARGNYEWYEIQAPTNYYAKFEEPRIVYQEIATYQAFAFTREPFYLNNKCFMIPKADYCLLALLNSITGWFVLGCIVSKLQGGAYAMQSPYVSQFPVPIATPAQRVAIEAPVHKLLDAKGQGPQVAEWEHELNALVYELYGLTDDEIRIVEEKVV